jgi:hypothetical protein
VIRARFALTALVLLAACATSNGPARSFDDPAAQALAALPVPEYFATVALAGRVARGCDRYRFDAEFESQMNALRNAQDRGSLVAAMQRNAIEMETDVAERSFIARHRVDLASSDLCPAADAENLSASALSALLVPQ